MSSTACCARFYEQEFVEALLGESFHPGGLELSGRLWASMGAPAGAKVLDLACGLGATARTIALAGAHEVVGVDASGKSTSAAAERSPELPVRYMVARADDLPFDDAAFDAVVCECAFSTFEDKSAVAREVARVLRPGGRLGLSDMVLEGELPADLAAAAGPWACLQDALPLAGYQRVFCDAGLVPTGQEDESAALLAMALDLKRRLVVAGLGAMAGALRELAIDVSQARRLLDRGRDAVKAGLIRYCRLTFEQAGAS